MLVTKLTAVFSARSGATADMALRIERQTQTAAVAARRARIIPSGVEGQTARLCTGTSSVRPPA